MMSGVWNAGETFRAGRGRVNVVAGVAVEEMDKKGTAVLVYSTISFTLLTTG